MSGEPSAFDRRVHSTWTGERGSAIGGLSGTQDGASIRSRRMSG